MHGCWCMTEPPEVRAGLANLGVPTADYERTVMPTTGRLVESRRGSQSVPGGADDFT